MGFGEDGETNKQKCFQDRNEFLFRYLLSIGNMGWGCSLVVEYMPSMCEALGSSPSTIIQTTKNQIEPNNKELVTGSSQKQKNK